MEPYVQDFLDNQINPDEYFAYWLEQREEAHFEAFHLQMELGVDPAWQDDCGDQQGWNEAMSFQQEQGDQPLVRLAPGEEPAPGQGDPQSELAEMREEESALEATQGGVAPKTPRVSNSRR